MIVFVFASANFCSASDFAYKTETVNGLVMAKALWTDRVWKKHHPVSYKKASFCISDKNWYKQSEKALFGLLITLYILIASQAYGLHTQKQCACSRISPSAYMTTNG